MDNSATNGTTNGSMSLHSNQQEGECVPTENPLSSTRRQPQSQNGSGKEDDDGSAPAKREKRAPKNQIGAQWSVRLSYLGEDADAITEHANLSTLGSPLDMVKQEYGNGIYVYFKYLIYLIALNTAMGVFTFIYFIIAADKGLRTEEYSGLDLLFLNAFHNDTKKAWYGLTTMAMLGAFLAAPIYQKYQSYITNRLEQELIDDELNDPDEYDIIEENLNYTSRQRSNRRIISILLFFVVIIVQGFITYGIHVAFDSDSDVAALVIGALVASMKTVWKFLSKYMTRYEKHRRKRTYIEWDTTKVFLMRIANVLGVYLTKFITEGQVIDEDEVCEDADEGPDCECPLAAMGQQFFWILMFEITIGNFAQVLLPWAMMKYKKRSAIKSGYGDEYIKSQFDLTDEFTEVLYRQFIIYLGTLVFPLLPLIGATSYVLEYWVDKYRLIYLCRKPMNKPSPVRARVLFVLHLLVAIFALFSFPNGMVFMFMGFDLDGDCLFWGSVGSKSDTD